MKKPLRQNNNQLQLPIGWQHEQGTAQTMIWHWLKYQVELPKRLKP
jgi:hypothetical protein